MCIFILYVYIDIVRSFIDWLISSIFHIPTNDVGIYVVPVVVVSMFFFIVLGLLSARKPAPKPKTMNLDPNLTHVGAHLFFPWQYWRAPLRWYFKRDLKHLNGIRKTIVNWDSKKAFYIGDYAQELLVNGKIQWLSERPPLEKWVESQKLTLISREALESDLFKPIVKEPSTSFYIGGPGATVTNSSITESESIGADRAAVIEGDKITRSKIEKVKHRKE